MLQIQGINKAFGDQILFQDAGCLIEAGEKVGLVGANGHGKSTLLKMILREMQPDGGQISVSRGIRVGHLSQHLVFSEPSVLEEACLCLQVQEEGYIEIHRVEAIHP